MLKQVTLLPIMGFDRSLSGIARRFILNGGILEEHRPHLPSFTEGYSNEWLTQNLAEAMAARAGWAVLVFPICSPEGLLQMGQG